MKCEVRSEYAQNRVVRERLSAKHLARWGMQGNIATASRHLVAASSASSTAVVHATLGNGSVGAGSAGSNILPDNGAAVADTELAGTVANNCAIRRASAVGRTAGRATGRAAGRAASRAAAALTAISAG